METRSGRKRESSSPRKPPSSKRAKAVSGSPLSPAAAAATPQVSEGTTRAYVCHPHARVQYVLTPILAADVWKMAVPNDTTKTTVPDAETHTTIQHLNTCLRHLRTFSTRC